MEIGPTFHCCDGALGAPVDGRDGRLSRVHVLANLGEVAEEGARFVAEHLLVLGVGLVSERASVGELEGGLLGVVGVHEVHGVLESLGDGAVALALHSLELCPLLLVCCNTCDEESKGGEDNNMFLIMLKQRIYVGKSPKTTGIDYRQTEREN